MHILEIQNIGDLRLVVKAFRKLVKDARKFAFYGNMGVGKTTFIKELCKDLGTIDMVNSPTFSLINEYKTINNELIYHIDLYRITDISELFDMGYEEYFYGDNYVFIEWPEKADNLIPADFLKIRIDEMEKGVRKLIIQ